MSILDKKIILLQGVARSGKDTLANYIYEEVLKLDKTCLISPNAGAVKELARNFFSWDGIKTNEGRKLLIDITNAGYNYDENFWEKKNIINDYDKDVYIITDFRYKITYDWFNKEGYDVYTVHIHRKFDNGLSEELKNDKSEQGFKDILFDYDIENDTLEDLKIAAKTIVKDIMGELSTYVKDY